MHERRSGFRRAFFVFSNIWKLRAGDLATELRIAHCDDYSHICRTVAIDPKELLKS